MSIFENKKVAFATLSTCSLFLISGAVNRGFSGYLFAIPFVVPFLFALFYSTFCVKTRVIWFLVVAVTFGYFRWNPAENRLIYPYIGDQFTVSCNWQAVRYPLEYTGHRYITLIPLDEEIDQRYAIETVSFDCQHSLTLVRVFEHHADFGTQYHSVFATADGKEVVIDNYRFEKAVERGDLVHPELRSSYLLQSRWSFNLSMLMMWPALPIFFLSRFD